MFSPEEIAHIEQRMKEGATPQQIAAGLGLAHSSFRAKLADSGYRIVIERQLQKIVVVEPVRASA